MSVRNSQFKAEVLPHLVSLQKAAFRLRRNRMDADDLVQETLLRALRHWNKYTPGTNCKAWLLRILNNQHINEWRVSSKRAFSVDIDRLPESVLTNLALSPVTMSSPEQEMTSQIFNNDLNSAICQLKSKFRRIVLLHFFNNLSYRQIAQLTDINLGTVKSRLYRGRQLLRKSLHEYAINNRQIAQNGH